MKQRKPIPRKRQRPRRKRPDLFFRPPYDRTYLDRRSYVTKGGRVRLFGLDYELFRWSLYMRACAEYSRDPLCECGCGLPARWNLPEWHPDHGEPSHNEHGPWKSDELDRAKWMRHECHMRLHNGGKPVPAKEIA